MNEGTQQLSLTKRFISLFNGERSRFVRHSLPFTKGKEGNPNKLTAKSVLHVKEAGEFVTCTEHQYSAHLNGEAGLALSPLVSKRKLSLGDVEDVCPYIIIDIDRYDKDYSRLLGNLRRDGYKFAPFRSKSGGLHIIFFFKGYEKASEARKQVTRIIDVYGMKYTYNLGAAKKVELFPDKDSEKVSKSVSQAVFLPWFNSAGESPNKLIMPDGSLAGIEEGIGYCESQMTTLAELTAVTDGLPYSDAPYCVQALLLSGELTDGMGRNNFLFTAALYLKMKLGKDAFTVESLEELNQMMEEPLERQDVENTYRSASSKDFPIMGQCKKEPMCAYCDKAKCKSRAVSACKKEKGNTACNVEFGKMKRMMSQEPYYLLEARLAGSETPYKILRLDAAENLLNQRSVQRECIDKLGQVMWTVKQQLWEEILNGIMADLVEEEVEAATDTTELSDLRNLFHRYLTHAQSLSSNPFRVSLRQVHYENGKYYFQTEGFKEYLRVSKYALGRTNLREQLTNYGCQGAKLQYKRKNGTFGAIDCWEKEEDDFLKSLSVYYEDEADNDEYVIERDASPAREEDGGGYEDIKF